MRREWNAGLTLAYRDLLKLLRDRPRLISTFIFPFIFIGILGGSLQSSYGQAGGMDLFDFVFTGVLGQTLFQSAAIGIVSLIEDRENDFSQEIFIAPISRYTIILGKIVGESLVALVQAVGILAFAGILGVSLSLPQLLRTVPALIIVCLFGAAFGVLVLGSIRTQRAANQVFPFIMLPQFFLSGVFLPVDKQKPLLSALSQLSPMRYAIDLLRGFFYQGRSDYEEAVVAGPAFNLGLIGLLFLVFLVIGTTRFVKQETER